MNYEANQVRKAFALALQLMTKGYLAKEDYQLYFEENEIQSLLEDFAEEAEAALISANGKLYLLPKTVLSPFHLSNEQIRKELGGASQNIDIYLLYFCILIFIGEFYNSFKSVEIQRNFITLEQWLNAVNERIGYLKNQDKEVLQEAELGMRYNWQGILEKWDAWNDLKESSNLQKGNTASRMSFLHKTVQFMERHELTQLVGIEEYAPSEKCKVIVQRYFMEIEYNRDIIRFMYSESEEK